MTVSALALLRDRLAYVSKSFTPDEWNEICRALAELEKQLVSDAIKHVSQLSIGEVFRLLDSEEPT